MKFNNKILAAGAALLLLASCGGKGEGESRSIADYGEISTADSLLYYFGQLRAADYWQFAKGDSTLAERASRDEYLKGLRAGLPRRKGPTGSVSRLPVLRTKLPAEIPLMFA